MIPIEQIEESIARFWGWRENIIVPNISFGLLSHEADILIMTKSGYLTEVEIKRSLADLKADAKKKHDHKDRRIKELYFAIPGDKYDQWVEFIPKHAGVVCYSFANNRNKDRLYSYIKRKAVVANGAIALTDKEMFQLARLGTMRIWGLKKKVVKYKSQE